MMAPSADSSGARSCHVDEAGLQPDREVLVEADPQVRLALGLLEHAEGAHLGAVLRAGANLLRTGPPELGEARVAVLDRFERGNEPRGNRVADCLLPAERERDVLLGCVRLRLLGLTVD